MGKLDDRIRSAYKGHALVVLGAIASAALLSFPLQHHISLGRFQHYGLCAFVLGLGYVMQVVWSWPHLRKWQKAGYSLMGLYLTSIGMILYANPWLDPRTSVLTEEQENLKKLIALVYSLFCLPIAAVYVQWTKEEAKAHKENKQ